MAPLLSQLARKAQAVLKLHGALTEGELMRELRIGKDGLQATIEELKRHNLVERIDRPGTLAKFAWGPVMNVSKAMNE